MSRAFAGLGRLLIADFDRPAEQRVRIRCGYAAGWVSISVLGALFAVRLGLGLAVGAVSVVAAAFTLLADLLAAMILVASFWVSGRPATARTPFGHGRMEQVAPLLIAFVLFFLGVEIAREAAGALGGGHTSTYWSALPWILLGTAAVKEVLSRFVRYLGRHVDSTAIEETASHLRVDGFYALATVGGLFLGHLGHLPWIDAAIGLAGAAVILYLSFQNARHALIPILGQAPPAAFLERIRETSRTVPGVSDVHEIVVHDYGSLRVISLHAEISERHSPAESHGIAEGLEETLRRALGGDVIVHTDPLMALTPALAEVERRLRAIVAEMPQIKGCHDFRVVAHSEGKIIIIADISVDGALGDEERETLLEQLRQRAAGEFPEMAYSAFSLASRFSY